ncbi:MAG: hypothetical protein JNK87_02385 [Bryobacterales bacterium]|nr:hypothetical protein [Bryobacterales bacterium]
MKTLLFGLAIPLLAVAQIASVDLTAPTAGYRFDAESQSLRSIEGVPGAASLGEAMALGVALESVWIAPSQRLAFGVAPGGTTLVRVGLDGATASGEATEIPAGEVFYSPGSQAMAVRAGSRLEIWTGLASSPQRLASLEIDEGVAGVAVSDDGHAVTGLRDGVLLRLSESGPVELATGVRAAAFLNDTHDLLLVQDGALVLLPKLDGDRREELAALGEASQLRLSADGSKVLLAAGSKLLVMPARGGEAVAVEAGGAVHSLATANGVAFQVALTDGRLYLLDAGEGPPTLSLVDSLREGGVQ